jgi:hypothetical protein
VDDAEGVNCSQSLDDLLDDRERALERDRTRGESFTQALALHVLEHQIQNSVREPAKVAGCHDVRVIDSSGGHRFALEARNRVAQRHHRGVEQLERERFASVNVVREIQGAERTLTEDAVDPVAPLDRLVDPRGVTAGRARGGVRQQARLALLGARVFRGRIEIERRAHRRLGARTSRGAHGHMPDPRERQLWPEL